MPGSDTVNDFNLEELELLNKVFDRAAIGVDETAAKALQQRIFEALEQRRELESLDFDDCLGGGCKL